MGAELKTGFDCSVCGEHHAVLPLSYSMKMPEAVKRIPLDEVEKRVAISVDQCVIDGKDFYLRCRIPVPIHDFEEPFIWGIWVEVSPRDFIKTAEQWTTEGRENEPPFTGWIATEIWPYDNTLGLAVDVQTMPVGRRPHLLVKDEEHKLAREQRDGISLARARELAELILHSPAR